MTLSAWTKNRAAFSICFSFDLSHLPSTVVLTERLLFQVQDVSISTFWWSPFMQPLKPCDLTTVELLTCHRRDVKAGRPDNTRRKRSNEQRLLLFASSLITVCSSVWRCLFMSVDIRLRGDVWYVLSDICLVWMSFLSAAQSAVRCSVWHWSLELGW